MILNALNLKVKFPVKIILLHQNKKRFHLLRLLFWRSGMETLSHCEKFQDKIGIAPFSYHFATLEGSMVTVPNMTYTYLDFECPKSTRDWFY